MRLTYALLLLYSCAAEPTGMRLGRQGVVRLAGAATWCSSRGLARAWCGEPFPPFAYSLPWFEFPVGGLNVRVVGDAGVEAKAKRSPLLVIPSPGLSYGYFEGLEALTVSQRRIAFAELPLSGGDATDAAALGAKVVAVVKALEAQNGAHILAHGLAAPVALAACAAAPASAVRSLSLASPIGAPADVERSQRQLLVADGSLAPLLASNAARGRACVDEQLQALPPAELVRAQLSGADGGVAALADAVAGRQPALPVLVARGARDVSSADVASDLLRRLPDVRLIKFDRSGSLPHIDEKNVFTGALLDFLDGVEGSVSRRAAITDAMFPG